MARKRTKFHEHGLHDDIRYKGLLSFQGFQVLGWICITVMVIMMLMKIAVKVNPDDAQRFTSIAEIISYIADMSLPFLLMANFARILNNSEGYKKQLMRNGGATVAIALIFLVFFNRYVVGTIGLLLQDSSDAYALVMTSFYGVNHQGFLAFNIFTDLLLCTLFMYFMNARPKKVFTGKKIYIFRAFAVLPVAYEVASLACKGLSAAGQLRIPSWAFPLLTVKPPMTFVVFMILAIYIKTRELRYCRHGRTHEEYQDFLKTNRNAWNFSVFTAVILFVAGVIDLIIFVVMILNQGGTLEGATALIESELTIRNTIAYSVGFGKAMVLMIFAPIVLLFNYTKIPKDRTVSMLIPVVGIGLIVLIVIQGVYQLVSIAPIPKIDGKELTETLNYTFGILSGQ